MASSNVLRQAASCCVRFEYTLNWDEKGRYRPRKETIDLAGTSARDHVFRVLAETGQFYENDLLYHLAVKGPRGGLVIDVGANIGNHAVFFGKFLAQHTVCIEPSRRLGPILRRNLAANGVANYSVLQYAVGDSAGFGQLVIPQDAQDNCGVARLVVAEEAVRRCGTDDPVAVRTLDSVLADLDKELGLMPLQLIKIDVEGMQLDVLRGARRVLMDRRPQLVVEAATDDEKAAIDRFLAEFGYEAIGPFCATPTYHYIDRRVHRLRRMRLDYRAARTVANACQRVGRTLLPF